MAGAERARRLDGWRYHGAPLPGIEPLRTMDSWLRRLDDRVLGAARMARLRRFPPGRTTVLACLFAAFLDVGIGYVVELRADDHSSAWSILGHVLLLLLPVLVMPGLLVWAGRPRDTRHPAR